MRGASTALATACVFGLMQPLRCFQAFTVRVSGGPSHLSGPPRPADTAPPRFIEIAMSEAIDGRPVPSDPVSSFNFRVGAIRGQC